MLTKELRFENKANAVTPGGFTGRASVYSVEDHVGDVVMPGAFTNHLREHGNRIPVLNQHDPKDPIGWATLTDSPTALLATGHLLLEVQSAKDMYVRLQNGVVDGISIGYEVVKDRMVKGVRQLHEIKLWEISLVTFPANQFARVTDVKTHDSASREFRTTLHEVHAVARGLAALANMPDILRMARGLDTRLRNIERAKAATTTLTGVVQAWVASGSGTVLGEDGRVYTLPVGILEASGLDVNALAVSQPIEFEASGEQVTRVLRLIVGSVAKSDVRPTFTSPTTREVAGVQSWGFSPVAELRRR